MDRDTLINHMRDVARQRASMMTDEAKLSSAKITTLLSIREETQMYLAAYYITIEELQAILGYTREEATAIVDGVKDDIHQQALIEMPEWAKGESR